MNSYPNQNPDSNWWTPQNLPDQNQPNASQWGQSQMGQPYGGQAPYQQGGYPYQQPYYQQGDYQQNLYQQASPYAPARPAIVFDYRYLAAAIGAIVSTIAFFLTYYSFSFALLGTTTTDVASGAQLAESQGRYWLDLIIALVAIIIPVLLQFGKQWFRTSTAPMLRKLIDSLDTKPRDWGLWLFITGLAGIFVHFILDLNHIGEWGVGAWFYLLGMVAVAVGGFLVYRPPASMSSTTTTPPTFR